MKGRAYIATQTTGQIHSQVMEESKPSVEPVSLSRKLSCDQVPGVDETQLPLHFCSPKSQLVRCCCPLSVPSAALLNPVSFFSTENDNLYYVFSSAQKQEDTYRLSTLSWASSSVSVRLPHLQKALARPMWTGGSPDLNLDGCQAEKGRVNRLELSRESPAQGAG